MKILGALIILAGFVLFAQFQYIPAFICLVIGAIFMGKPRTPREEPEEDGQDSELVRVDAPLQKVRSTNTELRRLAFPVDEVTMNNDDGSSRQEYLRLLCGGEDMAVVDVWFDDYLFGGKLCIRVMTEQGCVGQIRPKDVTTVRSYFGKAVRMIYLDGKPLADFTPDVFEYTYYLYEGQTPPEVVPHIHENTRKKAPAG